MSDDVWREDARTDRAIEYLRRRGAKTDADGTVVPTYRYSRNFGRVAEFLLDLVWGAREETVTISKDRNPASRTTTVTVTIAVTMEDGTSWQQEGKVLSSETAYSWTALATCRALLNFCHDDGEQMSPNEVIAMLEGERSLALVRAREFAAAP